MATMIPRPGVEELDRFRRVIAARLGLAVDESRLGSLADVLSGRARAAGLSCASYLDGLEAASASRIDDEIRALAIELTVGETYFFRHQEQLRAFAEVVLPERVADRGADRRLAILSAGCASGEEPYSLAMLLREHLDTDAWAVSIRAVDVDPRAIARAVAGRYTSWSLRETSPALRARWFRSVGRDHALADEIRAMVAFEERNLAHEDLDLFPPSTYDAVFCRNVLMYFEPERARAVIARIARALVPGGALFLGHAETLRGLSDELEIRGERGAFFYEKSSSSARTGTRRAASDSLRATPETPRVEDDGAWVDVIRAATDRVSALADGARVRAARSDETPATPSALELIRSERFGEALDRLAGAPPHRDVLVLRAVALIQIGRIAEGEATCADLLALEPRSAVGHYLLGLCREASGDAAGATALHRAAAGADPSFAMPRLHAGVVARRAGDRATARRELAAAIDLLEREADERIVLFGGGFSRDGLVALCRAELAMCTGAA